jgi:hypothetical protein
MWKSPEDRRASWRAGRPRMALSLHTGSYGGSLQNRRGVAALRSVGSTPAPLRRAKNRRRQGVPGPPSRSAVPDGGELLGQAAAEGRHEGEEA